MSFLHGIENKNASAATQSGQEVATAVIGLIGIAPKGNGGVATKIITTPEVKAVASLAVGLKVLGTTYYVRVNSWDGNTDILATYAQGSGDTTTAILMANLADAITNGTSGYTAIFANNVLNITAKAGMGVGANVCYVAIQTVTPTFQYDFFSIYFSGGVSEVSSITYPVNPQALILCSNEMDDAQFGSPLPGFNIPKTLGIIRSIAGNCKVLVINVFNPNSNTTQVTDEVQTVLNGKLKLAYAPIGDVTIKNNSGSSATITKDIDYSLDEYGNFIVLSTTTADGTIFKFSYKKLNAASVSASQIVGSNDSDTEMRTGCKLFDLSFNTFGFRPKIFIAPGYSGLSGVVAEFARLANLCRGDYFIDAPYGTTVSGAIAGRGISGAINFNTQDARATLCYLYVKSYDTATDSDLDYPLSAFLAAVAVVNDRDNGFWSSWSNKAIGNATGVEKAITWSLNDANCQANLLNAAGITTVVSNFGTGYLIWGNRNASYPTSTDPKNFTNIRRIDDTICDQMEQDNLSQLDKGITQSFIDNMVFSGNVLMNELVSKGAILPGSNVKYLSADNSNSELAAGHIVFTRTYMGTTPAERITFKNVIDISLFANLK